MNIILLSGGSGKRLWPLSNDVRSKQFLKLFKNTFGEYESMVQRVYGALKRMDHNNHITIATSKTQVSALRNQLDDKVDISLEPCRRDTFPAIALASAYLHDVKHISDEEAVVVCPVDPYVNDEYFKAIMRLGSIAEKSDAKIVLMGMEPTYPSEKYGYIIPETTEQISTVREFKEKPDMETAKEYIGQGALWNGGVFAYHLGYVLEKSDEILGYRTYKELFEHYEELMKISFDYAVVEKEKRIEVMRFLGDWKDMGTWNTLTEAMKESYVGNVKVGGECRNLHVINELDIPILCMGLKDIVVSASPDGILISDKEQSSFIKPYVDEIKQKARYEEKSWGSFRVIDVEEKSMTIKVILKKGKRMNYHKHQYREEIWTVIQGRGRTIIDGAEREIKQGDTVLLPIGCCHTVIAEEELHMIEVQSGKSISVEDKVIVPFP
ncbi:MAG: sugar phosphate nucleotidyltransferase [Lachnospiraceae bacterium]